MDSEASFDAGEDDDPRNKSINSKSDFEYEKKDSNISRPEWLMYNPNNDPSDSSKLKLNTSNQAQHLNIISARKVGIQKF